MIRAAFAAAALALAFPAGAFAAPATVQVRIEGYERTLFEGPMRGDGQLIRAASDDQNRLCNGTNNFSGLAPGPTPTSISVDAMRLIGEPFDGDWYPGYDDYFVKRLGPDEQDPENYFYWGVLVDETFTPVGGCQLSLTGGKRVLWAANAFNGRAFLHLRPNGTICWFDGEPITLAMGDELKLAVDSYTGAIDGAAQNLRPAPGITVAPVETTSPKLFQHVLTDDPSAVVTDAGGTASVSFSTPGWKRIKAEAPSFVRSNRIDICVPATGKSDCGPLPADLAIRSTGEFPTGSEPAADRCEPPTPTVTATTTAPPATTTPAAPPGPVVSGDRIRIRVPRVQLRGGGRVTVSWSVTGGAPGPRAWTIESKALNGNGPWVRRAHGDGTGSQTGFKLPAGVVYGLRLHVTDAFGKSSTASAGQVTVLRKMRRSGRLYAATLAAGRPLVRLRNVKRRTVVTMTAAGWTRHYSIGPRKLRELTGASRSRGGQVQLRIISGGASVDGAAAAP